MEKINVQTTGSVQARPPHKKAKSNMRAKAVHQKIFYYAMVALPLLQFLLFYVVVNADSLLLAFQKYDYDKGMYVFNGLQTFKEALTGFFGEAYLRKSVGNSLLLVLVSLVVGLGGATLFSFYIYKKFPLAETFKFFLFLPSIISSIAMVLMFRYFVELGIPAIFEQVFHKKVTGLITNDKTAFGTVMFFSVWVSFGPNILMISGAMNDISPSVVESAKLDGITTVKELWFITLPLIWETFVTFTVVTVAGTFVNQMHLFSFFSHNADLQHYTVGYYLYRAIYNNSLSLTEYPVISAQGITFTCITIPATFLVRGLMRKFGPSES